MSMPVISAYDFANFAEETFSDDSPLKTFYRGKVVLVTGGTGDLGQVYVEKLLRCDIKRLYLLVRDGDDDRLQRLISSALFASLRKSKPRFPQLIQLVTGDLSAVGLGLSAADRATLCANVQLIVHAGAGARFTARLADATLTNVRGTQQLLRLAQQMPGLLGVAHVSTVFAPAVPRTGGREPTEERCYETNVRPEGLIAVVERLLAAGQSAELDLLASHLIRPWPNAYAFTMALAERLVKEAAEASAALPAVLVRTSLVLSTLEDPTAGYTSSASAINGLMIAITTGAMRVLPVPAEQLAPVCLSDYAVNVTLAAMHRQKQAIDKPASGSPPTVAVYNATVQHEDLRWGSLCAGMVRNAHDNPLLGSVWTPRVHLLSACPYQVWWFVWMYEVLPGLLMDGFLRTVGCSVRVMPRVRLNEAARLECGFVLAGEWDLVSERAKELFKSLDKSDRAFFPFDLAATFYWNDYSYKYGRGLQRYVLGESLNDQEKAQRRQRNFRWAHGAVLTGYYASMVAVSAALLRAIGVCAFAQRLLA